MKKRIAQLFLIILAMLIGAGLWMYFTAFNAYDGKEPVRIYVPAGSSFNSLKDTLTSRLGEDYGGDVVRLFKLRHGDIDRATGSYVINPGDRAWSVNNRLRTGTQSPVRLTFNNIRTFDDLAKRVSDRFMWDADAFKSTADSLLPGMGFDGKETYPAAFTPDTYEFFWTTAPEKVITTLVKSRNDFWNSKRRDQAKALGLTPVEVTTLASIVEEETAKNDEKGKVARLYMNRLAKGMKLQADPTVKFALGDFALRRIGDKHLETVSPYNTYQVTGLPPGPIRIPEKSTINAVLNAPRHDYLYMCAKADFSGYHDFAVDYNTHMANARAYQTELNKRNIH